MHRPSLICEKPTDSTHCIISRMALQSCVGCAPSVIFRETFPASSGKWVAFYIYSLFLLMSLSRILTILMKTKVLSSFLCSPKKVFPIATNEEKVLRGSRKLFFFPLKIDFWSILKVGREEILVSLTMTKKRESDPFNSNRHLRIVSWNFRLVGPNSRTSTNSTTCVWKM